MKKWARLAHYHAGELGILLHLGQRQLYRQFTGLFGCSPTEWLKQQRMIDAKRKLRSGKPSKNATHDLAFSHCSSFSRWFKVNEGCTVRKFSTAWARGRTAASEVKKSRNHNGH
jgi:AraC-like DNA-binding protein